MKVRMHDSSFYTDGCNRVLVCISGVVSRAIFEIPKEINEEGNTHFTSTVGPHRFRYVLLLFGFCA